MATWYTDADWAGSGEFVEGQVSLATEFTLPAGQISRFRWPWPTIAPAVTPMIRLYNATGTLLASVPFDTTTLDAWNWATPGSAISVSAGTYRATVTTTRYPAKSGFFSGGSVTRGGVTAVQGRFDSGDVFPTQISTAAYLVDVDFTASGGSTVNGTATLTGAGTLSAAALTGSPGSAAVTGAGSLSASPRIIAAGTAALAGTGSLTAVSSGRIVYRPNTGTVVRPYTGIVTRP